MDTVLAEAVGSCPDRQATVVCPPRRRHGGRFLVAPLLAVVDPARFTAIGRAGRAGPIAPTSSTSSTSTSSTGGSPRRT